MGKAASPHVRARVRAGPVPATPTRSRGKDARPPTARVRAEPVPATPTRSRGKDAHPPAAPAKRASRRCRQCPDRPLLSECQHRFRGRQAEAAAPSADDAPLPVPASVEQVPVPAPIEESLPALDQTAALAVPAMEPTQDLLPPSPEDEEDLATIGEALTLATSNEKAKRAYPSDSNPFFGVIEGLGRGNEKTKMARVRELKHPYADQATANKRFDVLSRDLLTRAEALAHRTSGWVYVAVHHPSARTSFLHFTSRKLRKEAPEEVHKIHKEAGKMMSLVKRADRVQVINYERERADAQEKLVAAQEAARVAQAEALRWKAQADAGQRVISSLMEKSAA
ncbi:hypothetical protein EST38_g10631 [Candolleomyces aberdarensis]|uniref:Uncharacterized protein n=1 Tax=Candolleomyces aberdarensis TaxID=2316362 RepID=A0A4V1Q2I6_9AGAR|nr:hypothetical protein EST38_g10631 [Candolleomyces aberdarensis]